MLMHHPVDPLFLVIPLLLPLITSDDMPYTTLSSLMTTASSSSAHSLSAPFTKDTKGKGKEGDTREKEGFNPDVGRLLEMKSVKTVFKHCCEQKGTLHRCHHTKTPSLT
jgi:ribonuclease H2 subunit B